MPSRRAARGSARPSAGPAPRDDRYARALAALFARRRFGMRPGLEVIRPLLAELGDPERSFESIHVAGSKGKGSVSAMVASVLARSAGPAGLFTSPHLQSYRERIRVDGRAITPAQVVAGLDRVTAKAEALLAAGRIDRPPTFFEATTALGFDHFARAQVRSAAVEVGLGGEFDATNVVRAPVAVLTTIELEHTDILGRTIADIARAKAGILHPGMRAVTGEEKPDALGEIARWADRRGVPLWRFGREVELGDRTLTPEGQTLTIRTPHAEHAGLSLPLQGGFQARNAAVAVAALDLYELATGRHLSERALRDGLARVRWRGRLERIAGRPELFLDVAHTRESATALAAGLGELRPFLDPEENALLFGCLSDKPAEEMLAALAPLARTVVLVPVRSAGALPPKALKLSAVGRFSRVLLAPTVASGLALARSAADPAGFVLATGSDYLVGELLDELEGRLAAEPDLSDPVGVPPERPTPEGPLSP